MLHGPQANEGTGPSEACFAVDCDCSAVISREVVIAHLHELVHDVVRWSTAVDEEQVVVSNVFVSEESLVILLLIESDDPLDAELLEDLHILIGVVAVPLVLVSLLDGAHEGHELARNNPVEIAIFNSLVLLIFSHIECLKFIPPKLYSVFETLEALEKGALIEAVAFGGVSVGLEQWMVRFEVLVSLLCGALEHDDHETAHEKCSIHHFVWLLRSAVVEDTIILVILVSE